MHHFLVICLICLPSYVMKHQFILICLNPILNHENPMLIYINPHLRSIIIVTQLSGLVLIQAEPANPVAEPGETISEAAEPSRGYAGRSWQQRCQPSCSNQILVWARCVRQSRSAYTASALERYTAYRFDGFSGSHAPHNFALKLPHTS